MKSIALKIVFAAGVLFFLLTLESNLLSYDDGITGLTKKTGGVGCVCHGFAVPDTTVHVFFTGVDSVPVGQTVFAHLHIKGGPHVKAGLDVAVLLGRIDTINETDYTWRDTSLGEVTHRMPQPFATNYDTVSFTFRYTAPNYVGIDTLYANGNSVNGNDLPDTNDRWNFSPNTPVRVYVPIGIMPINSVARSFSLSQNYPNPFNPVTDIEFSLPGTEIVKIIVYDITGKEIKLLINQQLSQGKYKIAFDGTNISSGIYFYRIVTSSPQGGGRSFTETKKMMLVK